MTTTSESLRGPWWGPQNQTGPPNPIFTTSLFALANKRLDAGVTLLLVTLIALSRFVAFPASIWEQDEAYFSAAVVDFDVTANHPHPPWFPLWIALGKLLHLVVDDPAKSLQIVSCAASVWIIFPLTALFALWLRRDLAIAAALLFLFTPVTLILSCRAFSGLPATALLAAGFAFWLRKDGGERGAFSGSVVSGLCLLIRPHLLLAVAAVCGYRILRSRMWRERMLVVGPLVVVVLAGFGAVAIDAGGIGPLRDALTEHGQYHFGSLAGATLGFADSGLSRAFLLPALALLWSAMVLFGIFTSVHNRRRLPVAGAVAFLGLLPLVIAVGFFSYAGNVRYFLPIVALGSGFAVLGLALVVKRWTLAVAAAVCVATFVSAQPALSEYRQIQSPPIRGVAAALSRAGERGAVIVADRSLAAFFDYQRSRDDIGFTVLFDSQIGSETVAPPAWLTVAIYDHASGFAVNRSESKTTFEVGNWWLERLSQGRFLRISVASGAVLESTNGDFEE